MNYQHVYHAGNFADVSKHTLLILLLQHLQKKEAPYCFIDTHAGAGGYDLSSAPVQKTGEYREGVQRLLTHKGPLPDTLATLTKLLQQPRYCRNGQLFFYPGCPEVAKTLLRPQDRMVLNEYHPQVYQALKQYMGRDKSIAVHQRDAYEFLPAVVPPKEKRGLVLVDPPFEKPTEFQDINACLQKALTRWPTGVYLIWSPITGRTPANPTPLVLRSIRQPTLTLEFTVSTLIPQVSGLVGCRYWIINPPFQFESEARTLLTYFGSLFSTQK